MTSPEFRGEYVQLGHPTEATDLIRSTGGPVYDEDKKGQHSGIYFIRWAGCLYGPSDKLEDICKDELLAQAKDALADTQRNWTPQRFTHTDELGYLDIEDDGSPLEQCWELCPCGSGLHKEAQYDGYGIFLTYTCEKCEPEKMSKFRSDIHERYEADEPIDEE